MVWDSRAREVQGGAVGPFVERFEVAFAEYVGTRHAVAVSSGTAALHLAFRVLASMRHLSHCRALA